MCIWTNCSRPREVECAKNKIRGGWRGTCSKLGQKCDRVGFAGFHNLHVKLLNQICAIGKDSEHLVNYGAACNLKVTEILGGILRGAEHIAVTPLSPPPPPHLIHIVHTSKLRFCFPWSQHFWITSGHAPGLAVTNFRSLDLVYSLTLKIWYSACFGASVCFQLSLMKCNLDHSRLDRWLTPPLGHLKLRCWQFTGIMYIKQYFVWRGRTGGEGSLISNVMTDFCWVMLA